MRTRQLYLLAGVLWTVLLAPMAALMTIGVGAGFAWIFVFGDNPWPKSAELFLLALGATAAIFSATAIIVIANRAGRAHAANQRSNSASLARHAIGLTITPVGIALLAAGLLWLRAHEHERSMAVAAINVAKFTDLIASTQKLTALEIDTNSEGTIATVARFVGRRQGAYELQWRVVPASAQQAVLEGRRALRVTDTSEAVPISFKIDELRAGYQAIILGGRGGALIDEHFRLEVSLDPVLTADETEKLPAGEGRRLHTAASSLESRRSTDFPVRFTIPP